MDEQENNARRWRNFEFAGVSALAVTLICLFIGQAAEQYASQVTQQPTEIAKVRPRFNAIDYATTAATKGATVIIGPCDSDRP